MFYGRLVYRMLLSPPPFLTSCLIFKISFLHLIFLLTFYFHFIDTFATHFSFPIFSHFYPFFPLFLFFLQHFEQTNGFDASQLLLLILDEADRILDLGFRTQLDGILQYLPPRQTMLFSATQTKSVKDLARLSLNQPQYVAVHALDKEVTPKQLLQNYVTVRIYLHLSSYRYFFCRPYLFINYCCIFYILLPLIGNSK